MFVGGFDQGRIATRWVSSCALVVLLVALALPGVAGAASSPWTALADEGSANTTVNPASDIFWDGTGLWLVWGTDNANVQVRRWNGTSWEATWPSPVNELNRNKMPSVTHDGSKPWVAWNSDADTVQVAYWDGSAWVTITSPGGASPQYATPDILWANGALHVAWQDSTKTVRVARWGGSSWTSLGSPGNGGTANTYPNLAWNGTELHVAWSQPNLALVARRSGSSWVAHSSNPVTPGNAIPTIEFVDGRLYMTHESSTGAGMSWWDGVQYRATPAFGSGPSSFGYGTVAWTGTRFYASYTTDPDYVEVARYDPVAPSAPTALGQFRSDGTTAIASGAWTPYGATSALVLKGTMSDPQSAEQLLPWVEVATSPATWTATCGQQAPGTSWVGTAASAPSAGTGVSGTTNVTGLVDGASYSWRMCVVDRFGFPSGWLARGSSPDLRVDASAPTATPTAPVDGATGVSTTPTLSATYVDPAPAANAGTVERQLCTSAACTTVLQSSTSASVASGTSVTWSPSTLTVSTTYWWRVRAVDVAGNTSAWTTRSFTTTAASTTISVDAATVALGTLTLATNATATSTLTVTTNSPGGYQLLARDESDAWAANSASTPTVADWTGTSASPTVWASGTTGGMGMTVLSVASPAAKDTARWGTGTAATDFTNNRYAGLKATTDTLAHQRTAYSASSDTVTVGWRMNLPLTQPVSTYDATISWTAVALP